MKQGQSSLNNGSSKSVNPRAKLDIQKLENTLLQELNDDKIYWQQNETKIKAVTTAPTYEEFR